jgi:uncharacterized protein YvpB
MRVNGVHRRRPEHEETKSPHPSKKNKAREAKNSAVARATTDRVSLPKKSELSDVNRIKPIKQEGNACGTTSAAMIFDYLGKPTKPEALDAEIRRADIFTAPHDIVEAAHRRGIQAAPYNNANLDEVAAHLKRGRPVQALIKTGRSLESLHYVAITAIDDKTVHFLDPATGKNAHLSRAEFEKQWGNVGAGFKNYVNVFAKKGDKLPAARPGSAAGAMTAVDGVANVVNGAMLVKRVSLSGAIVGVSGGVVQAVGGAVQTGIRYVAKLAESLGAVGRAVGSVLRGIGKAIGAIASTIGETFAKIGNFLARNFSLGAMRGWFDKTPASASKTLKAASHHESESLATIKKRRKKPPLLPITNMGASVVD